MADLAILESQKRSIQTSIDVATQQLNAAVRAGDTQRISELNAYIDELNASLVQVNLQISTVQSEQAVQSPESAAAAVAANENGATQAPSLPNQVVDTEGRVNPSLVESGTDAPTRTLEETQNVPEVGVPPGPSLDTQREPVAGGAPGAGAGNDDSGTRNNTKQIINSSFNNVKIVPQPNVLDQYASYTYSISWYLMAPEAYKQLLSSQKKSLAGFQLLMQSAGAPVSGDPNGAVRNPYFTNDYYIDNLELRSTLVGRGSGLSHNVGDIKFTVTEPQGITLIGNLYRAVDQYYKSLNITQSNFKDKYTNAEYCLVIRFYGYDANGNVVQVGKDINSSTDRRAVVEKFYPFNLVNISFKIASKVVEYQVEAKPIPYNIALGSGRGVIPEQIELSGRTLKDILIGNPVGANYAAGNSTNTADTGRLIVPNAPVAPGVLEAQAASNTDSSDFTDTRQPNLIATDIPGVASSF